MKLIVRYNGETNNSFTKNDVLIVTTPHRSPMTLNGKFINIDDLLLYNNQPLSEHDFNEMPSVGDLATPIKTTAKIHKGKFYKIEKVIKSKYSAMIKLEGIKGRYQSSSFAYIINPTILLRDEIIAEILNEEPSDNLYTNERLDELPIDYHIERILHIASDNHRYGDIYKWIKNNHNIDDKLLNEISDMTLKQLLEIISVRY